ncbi:hypothetical protein BS643_12565 [Pseudomonas protegens]|uniref:STAS-like domain-containing protein n=1 Tax=Pseudomonas protegens TaxID=380021 RepID=UPI0008070256|nr:STAS-like domain-containing protein [Pseudomonas protegens]OBZ25495.1 hypothetical protein BBH58_08460 [Pseudomonas protegens]OBZ31391.1 hypothetical protein BBH57_16280 [Pseudomonas protegens]OKK42814.1 hypothetical protein BS644_19835 [Pseudomonas protegens]OKK46372.1 hypothetical protein BS643_12565 [Pseudomonas protegens]OKK61368.1 hypothetical protein BS645_07990 [Pseudomonas protegens]
MQTQKISLARSKTIRTLGMRASATPYRKEIETSLDNGMNVAIDFSGNEATQSFVDELVGALVLKRGRGVLSRLSFSNCPDDVKAIIKFVINDRVHQLEDSRAIA